MYLQQSLREVQSEIMICIAWQNNSRMFKLPLATSEIMHTIMICFVLPITESATAICSRRAPIALRETSTLRTRVLFHFLAPPNFFFPFKRTLRVYSTLPRPWGKTMLGGRLADPGNKNTNGSV